MQVNIERGAYAHNMAHQLAHENKIDALLIQEPWTLKDLTAKRSISHPKFALFSRLDVWHTRPRVLITGWRCINTRMFRIDNCSCTRNETSLQAEI
ncbi:BgTH12-06332 [Blumeria graminis f. sp. triticale]|uniref:BgTH12-06332 n=1 Tax=Blumeria graminis f. sp. triticale TaxID=1689686 RepID=A0A9W4CXY8_BLUGR|nr:BgTH12-06332 [Blumeria graminis f. sp. triticale]